MKFLLLISLALTLSAESKLYTLDNLIESALLNSPDINITKSSFKASDQRVSQAKSDYLPKIDAQLDAGYLGLQNDSVKGQGGALLGSISASQLIYDFGKTGENIDTFKSDANASHELYKQSISNKIFEVKNAYYKIIQTKSLILVSKENIKLNEKQLNRAKKYFIAGIKTKIDVSDANVKLLQAKLTLQNHQYDLKLNHTSLDKIIGDVNFNSEDHIFVPKVEVEHLYETLPEAKMDLKEIVEFAYKHRHELKSVEANVQSAQHKIKTQDSDYYPQLYISGNYQYQKVSNDIALFNPEHQYNALVNLKWNLFNGLDTQSKVEEAKLNYVVEEAKFLKTKLDIKNEATQAAIYVLKAKDSVKLSQSLTNASKEKFEQSSQRYDNGLSDYIELQEARQDYIDSLSTLVTSYYDFYRASAKLDYSIGR